MAGKGHDAEGPEDLEALEALERIDRPWAMEAQKDPGRCGKPWRALPCRAQRSLAGRFRFPSCIGASALPMELRGGVFIGMDLPGHGGGAPSGRSPPPDLPVALIRGSRDGASRTADGQATWRQLRHHHP